MEKAECGEGHLWGDAQNLTAAQSLPDRKAGLWGWDLPRVWESGAEGLGFSLGLGVGAAGLSPSVEEEVGKRHK